MPRWRPPLQRHNGLQAVALFMLTARFPARVLSFRASRVDLSVYMYDGCEGLLLQLGPWFGRVLPGPA